MYIYLTVTLIYLKPERGNQQADQSRHQRQQV